MITIYKNGTDFIRENDNELCSELVDAKVLIDNAKAINSFYRYSYILKITDDNKFLILSRLKGHELYLYGSVDLVEEASKAVADYNLDFASVVGNKSVAGGFLLAYQKRMGGSIRLEKVNNDSYVGEFIYEPSNIKRLLLAGGCFWCMAKPYYEYDGVLKVLSGFCGGLEINPSYEDVKNQLTSHREAISIEYDSNKISYDKLLDIYFESINPFDDGGQYIDRGNSYTCAIFSDDNEVIDYAKYRIKEAEKAFMQKCYISLENDMVFYMAEEYHQDYALKNPEAMEEELIASGRKNN